MASPEVLYARRDNIDIAYQVVGDGPVDLVFINGLAAHMDLFWLEPEATAMLRHIGSFARLILFDKPGTGLSDPVTGPPTLDERLADVIAVMGAAGSTQAYLAGFSEGAYAAARFAAMYPERCHGLVLASASARWVDEPAEDWPYASQVSQVWRSVDDTAYTRWGSGEFMLLMAPTWRSSVVHRRTVGVFERAAASPGMARAVLDAMRDHYDMRALLPTVRVPTLVLHAEAEYIPVELGRDVAARVPGARFTELPGPDHIPFARDWHPFAGAIEEFVTGRQAQAAADRVLRTIVFVDIVESTRTAEDLGDERWRRVLERFEQLSQHEIDLGEGQLISRAGDGLLATFGSPSRAIRCALRLADRTREELGLAVRAGLHTAEVEVRSDGVLGIGVHTAARIQAQAAPGEVVVSSAVRDLVAGSGIDFDARGSFELKGVSGSWALFAVVGDAPAGARPLGHARPEETEVEPAAAGMTTLDRVAVRIARSTPGLSRIGFRVAGRLRSR